jgi:hypothetical protein
VANWIFPAASATLSGIFATLVLARWLTTRKRHHLLWTLGLYGFTGAAAAQVIADLNGGWPEGVYRAYYFLVGSLVATMGAGTVYLMNRPRLADAFLYTVIGLVVAQAAVCTVTAIDSARLAAGGTETGVGIASAPMRVLTVILNIAGAGALIVGALLSWRATARPHNLAILAGAVVLSIGGGTAGVAAAETFSAYALWLGNLAGIALLFAGFLLSRPAGEPAAVKAPAAPAAPPT